MARLSYAEPTVCIIHRQLTAEEKRDWRQLTAEGQFHILYMFLSLMRCVNSNFRTILKRSSTLGTIIKKKGFISFLSL